ncbi:MAG: hypothetical protein AB1758_02860 [Candidatus Eremiobacterota bacterium]
MLHFANHPECGICTASPVTEADALQAGGLPLLHRDPFDRLLVGQALASGCTVLTPDALIRQYAVATAW